MSDFDDDVAEMKAVEGVEDIFPKGWLAYEIERLRAEDRIRRDVEAEVRKRMMAEGF